MVTPTPTPVPLQATIIVNAAGGDDFTTIQDAVNAVIPGDVIQVKNGTYDVFNTGSRHGTESEPIYLEPYPGHNPVISGGQTPDDQIQLNAEWWVFKGFEIAGGYYCVRILDDHIVVADNHCHNSVYFGIVVVPADEEVSNIEISGNTIEAPGYVESGSCTKGVASSCTPHNFSGDTSMKNRHGIYLSNSTCHNISNVHIHGNTIRHYGGRGIQMNGSEGGDGAPCSADGISNILIENNHISNGSWGMSFFYGATGIEVKNNTFTLDSWPSTNDSDHTFFGIWGLTASEISGNTLSSTSSSMRPFNFYDGSSGCPPNEIGQNTWNINTDEWMWNGSGRDDFSSGFGSVSGCGG